MPKGIFKRTEVHNEKNRKGHLGQKAWNKGLKGMQPYMDISGFEKGRGLFKGTKGVLKSKSKGKPMLGMRGEKHPNWKGGTGKERHRIMGQIEYKLWRTAVFERDNYTCVWCGQRGGELNADHIQLFSTHPELRFAIDNGRTLCKACHFKRHNQLL